MIRISKINIKQFGLLKDMELGLYPFKATIVYGDNESGKTMLLDAILDALFSIKKMSEDVDGFDRYLVNKSVSDESSIDAVNLVSENEMKMFNGTIEMEIDNKRVTFPQEKSLDEIVSIPSLFAKNIFVVREGELRFGKEDEWWDLVKNKLSGHLNDYLSITDKIREIVGLESNGEWVNSPERPVASQHMNLNKRLEALKGTKSTVKKLASLTIQHDAIVNDLEEKQGKLDNFKQAKMKRNFLKCKELAGKHKNFCQKSIEYEKYNGGNLKIWRNTEMEIVKAGQIIELSKKYRGDFSSTIDKHSKNIEEWEKELASWNITEKEIVIPLEFKLAEYKQKKARMQRGSTAKSIMPIWMILCAISLVVTTFISYTMNPVFYTVSGILFIALSYSVKMMWSSRNLGSQLLVVERGIKDSFKHIDEVERDVVYINDWLFKKRNDYQELKKKVKMTSESELPDHGKMTEELSASIGNLESKLKKLESFTVAFKESSGCATWEELQEKCNEKETIDVNMKLLAEQLNELLETKWEEEWDGKLAKLESFKTVDIEWNENTARRYEEQVTELTGRLKVLNDEMVDIRIGMSQVDDKSLENVWMEEDETESELNRFKVDREAALVAGEVLKSVSQEQHVLVNNVISKGLDSATNLFSSITGNRYKNVFLNKNTIYVKTANNKTIPADYLSSGALAQLYFALRLNFAENLLDKKPGFFLLDDSFLFCDTKRKDEMINILKQISGKGWQFIYFTMDENIIKPFRDCFKEEINVFRLPSRTV